MLGIPPSIAGNSGSENEVLKALLLPSRRAPGSDESLPSRFNREGPSHAGTPDPGPTRGGSATPRRPTWTCPASGRLVGQCGRSDLGLPSGGPPLAQFSRLPRRPGAPAFRSPTAQEDDIEYPDGDSGVDAGEVDEALERATEIVAYAEKVIERLPVFSP